MRRQIVLRHPSSVSRRQPLLVPIKSSSSLVPNKSSSSSLSTLSSSSRGRSGSSIGGGGSVGFGEVAGGTAAECAAVCCCCPCVLVNFLVLTVYKLPAGLCRKAMQRKRRRWLMKKGVLPQRSRRCECGCDDTELQIHPVAVDMSPAADKLVQSVQSVQSDKDVIQLEKEMWDRFYGAGFWRSPSQRSNV